MAQELLNWQQRVVDDLEELQDKYSKLSTFLRDTPADSIDQVDRVLMFDQQQAMMQYINVLSARVRRFL
ncbi:hypothetical protein [Klebsiella phage vB_KpnS-VAC51]|uniref:Uncharacterized protein n=8 Tax=Viruses TaxID=10239 RepID=A0AAE9C6R9_9CAUD|nr:hypothetical protein [Klebsiella phage vB_KpnS-VAC51]CAD5239895.1 hypothetical protein EKKBBHHG_00083 [Klebsiella phage vB_KaS-Veronica]